jgi:hypothetical protein
MINLDAPGWCKNVRHLNGISANNDFADFAAPSEIPA